MPNFHNPYNFIPTPRRPEPGTPLGDCGPDGPARHGWYHADRYSGRLTVRCTARTPLLIPDAVPELDDPENNSTHKRYRTRVGPEGRPLLPTSSVRGMLRSAYEAVTNSRYGIFQGHDAPLARRMKPNVGRALVPFGAFEQKGELIIALLSGTSTIGDHGPQGPLYAAWIRQYATRHGASYIDQPPRGRIAGNAVRVGPNEDIPEHGDKVHAIVERRRYERGRLRFTYWDVSAMAKKAADLPQVALNDDRRRVIGWVCVTHQNMDRKHDERLFFYEPQSPPRAVVANENNKRQWRDLIRNYQSIERRGTGPDTMDYARWSRHIVGGKAETELSSGTLGYARVRRVGSNKYEILELYPVSISRELHGDPPRNLLHTSLHPAESLEELSPADRVFGWVSQGGAKQAYRGNLRIGAVRCRTSPQEAIESHDPEGVALTILGAPKPQQARFYVGRDPDRPSHMRDPDRLEYRVGRGVALRGRKTYPTQQALPDDYWEDPTQWGPRRRNGPTRYQEFRQPEQDGKVRRDDQNRSVLDWIRPGTEFEFDIDISNLDAVELGALLWLLEMPDGQFHRLGGGKPLGFGCVSLTVISSDIRTGRSWREYYRQGVSADEVGETGFDEEKCIRSFQEASTAAYELDGVDGFDTLPFIAAFVRSTGGHAAGIPTHYPRTAAAPNPEGRNYEWFVWNAGHHGPDLPLPDIQEDEGLPIA